MALQAEEDARVEGGPTPVPNPPPQSQDQDADADLAMALALQEEENRLVERPRHYEGDSKVRVGFNTASYSNLRTCDDDDEDFDECEADSFPEASITTSGGRRKRGSLYRLADGRIVSKHDAELCGRYNAKVLMSSEFGGIGDLGPEMRLSNPALNSLKRGLSHQQQTKKGVATSGRVDRSGRATRSGLDEKTSLTLFGWIQSGLLYKVTGLVKTGKEANVYHAFAPITEDGVNVGVRSLAIKVFKTTLNEFSKRAAYVDGDPRYAGGNFSKQPRKKAIKAWAEKEVRNLYRAHRSSIKCPEVVQWKDHVVLMTFIGQQEGDPEVADALTAGVGEVITDSPTMRAFPAPQLHQVEMGEKRAVKLYAQSLDIARQLLQQSSLVHGDLSPYNLLLSETHLYVIDFGQAVDAGAPQAGELLSRDLRIVADFFQKKGVTVLNPSAAFTFVTNYGGTAEEGLELVSECCKQAASIGGSPEAWEARITQACERCPHGTALLVGQGGADRDEGRGREEESGDDATEDADTKVLLGSRERARASELKAVLKAGLAD
ncbi:unnamed protein product [Chrysoparadoxa australica]